MIICDRSLFCTCSIVIALCVVFDQLPFRLFVLSVLEISISTTGTFLFHFLFIIDYVVGQYTVSLEYSIEYYAVLCMNRIAKIG